MVQTLIIIALCHFQ